MTDTSPLRTVALVTGASRGMAPPPRSACRRRRARRVRRPQVARSRGRGADPRAGGNATIAPLDLTDGDLDRRLAGAIAERWDRLDILVLNAAMLGH